MELAASPPPSVDLGLGGTPVRRKRSLLPRKVRGAIADGNRADRIMAVRDAELVPEEPGMGGNLAVRPPRAGLRHQPEEEGVQAFVDRLEK